jgi:hypothetical protein
MGDGPVHMRRDCTFVIFRAIRRLCRFNRFSLPPPPPPPAFPALPGSGESSFSGAEELIGVFASTRQPASDDVFEKIMLARGSPRYVSQASLKFTQRTVQEVATAFQRLSPLVSF